MRLRCGWTAALVLLAWTMTPASADQNDPRLAPLFELLRSSSDPARLGRIEGTIWGLWLQSGREDVDRLMEQGMEAMSGNRLRESIGIFARVVDLAPGFAEGWNKRATAYYLAGDLEASLRDVERTLALEPRHFGALSGLGLIRLAQGDELGALLAFEAVLELHPRAPAAVFQVRRLREKLEVKPA